MKDGKSILWVLSRIEWVFDWESRDDLCPECENTKLIGHYEMCAFGALLKELRGDAAVKLPALIEMNPRTEPAIKRALEVTSGNRAEAARLLGLPIRSFRRYAQKFQITGKMA